MIGEVLRRKWYIDLLASLVEPGPVKALEIWRDLEADYPPLLAANPTADESAWRRVANGFTATLSDRSLAHRVSASQIGTALLVNTKVTNRIDRPLARIGIGRAGRFGICVSGDDTELDGRKIRY